MEPLESSPVDPAMNELAAPDLRVASNALARRLRPLEGKAAGTLMVHEVYRSIQGESTFAGLPCVFVRLTACHLRCSYCDTRHAFQQGAAKTIDAVLDEVEKLGGRLVELTGGEPLLQEEAYPLMSTLADRGWTVLLETSGGVAIDRVDPRVHVVLDVKTPASGEVDANVWSNLDRIKPTDEVKFVLGDRDDFDWAVDVIRRRDLTARCEVLMGAIFGRVELADLAAWILETGLPIRLQAQLHKILWDPKARGV